MKQKLKALARASSTISVNGNIIEDKEMVMGTNGKKGKILTRDMNKVKYIDLNQKSMKELLSKRSNKQSLEKNLEDMLNKELKRKKTRRKKRKKRRRKNTRKK